MITKEKKQEIIKGLVDKFSRQKSVVFFDYTGLTVNQVQELREKLRNEKIDCQASKKTLIGLALKKAGLEGVDNKSLSGQIAMVFGYKDEVMPAKILYDFSKENENLKMLSGFIQKDYLESEAIMNLAKLPSKQELLGRLVGSITSPLSGLINVLQGNLRGLTIVLKNLELKA
ncbi:MAG: 50S ribosomal protein L10 [Patescibacteria group bacterium]|nr:50S ribosomal protein L10 [Patescibacteria group bacterium]